ncbi:MAG: histidine kinase [Candidatus Limivivens sp.]|nr:histidine kinase [Candidatus Limivivens sp.]
MPKEKLPVHLNHILYYLLFLLAMGVSVFMFFSIAGFQMNYLSYLLYDKSHLSAVYRLLSQYVLRKLLFSVLFFLISMVMLYLFYFSYYQLIYLKLSVLCLICIFYCMTLIETDTIFYIGTAQGQLWQNMGLISCVFLVLFFLYLAFDPFLEKHSFLFSLVPFLFYAGLAVFMMSRRYSRNVELIPLLFLSLAGLYLLFSVLCLLGRDFKTFFRALPAMLGSFFLLYANHIYRLHVYVISLLNRRAAYYDASLYVAVVAAGYLLCQALIQKRNLLMHSRDLNRKIKELEQSKYMLLGILYTNVKNYLFSARTALDSLQAKPELSDASRKDIRHLRSELANIDTLYNQIHNYTIFYRNSLNLRQVNINMDIFFRLLSERLSYSGLLLPTDSVQLPEGSGYADLFPEYLLQSIEDLIILLRQQIPDGCLEIKNAGDSRHISMILHFFPPKPLTNSRIKKGHPIFHAVSGSSLDLTSLDYVLSILKHQTKACGGTLKVSSDFSLILKLSFPAASGAPSPYKQETFLCRDTEASSVCRLLFLSSDAEQMAAVKKLLPFDRYHITIANDGDYFLEHPQDLAPYSLLIVGNLYRHTYFRDFYHEVRKYYPMTALPILMLLPDLYAENSFYIRSTINDYLIPPYSQVSLAKKIHSLVTVKKTADIALEAQLEFWQSQINPHFIFNSINSIMHMCIKEPMKAYELLDHFSEYLRGHLLSLSLNQLSTIQKEIDLISAYLLIEKARFGDKIHYELDIDCAEDFPILPLLIEPLVENSIKHSPLHETGVTVSVQIFQDEDQLLVRVEDNGNGMPQEIISSILSNTFESNSVGLSNVCSRLRHYYHTIPAIESSVGMGTTVQFTIDRKTDFHRKGEPNHAYSNHY